jgi:shikimate dehydrogenase
MCDQLTAIAQAVGAVNTLVIKEKRLLGHNTDVGGLEFALSQLDDKNNVSNALIIGGGGAARSAICDSEPLLPGK